MSLLLDALERADKERGQQLFTPTSHLTPATAVANEFRIKRWVVEVIIGSLLLGLVSYALFFRSSSEVSDPVTGTSAIETLPKSESFMPELPPNQGTQQAAAPQPVIIQIERSTKSLTSTEPVAASPSDSNVSKLYQQQLYHQQNSREALAEKEIIESTPSPATDVVANTAVVVDQNLVDPKEAFFQQVPLLSDMPTEFKRRIPSLKYSTHVYSKDVKGGFVNINGPFREVGSQLAPGLILIAILPEGVVMEFDGVLFRLRALTDWVGY